MLITLNIGLVGRNIITYKTNTYGTNLLIKN